MPSISEVWHSTDAKVWKDALDQYWKIPSASRNEGVERELQDPKLAEKIRLFDKQEWYDFLHDKYFVWKFTDGRRLSTSRSYLQAQRDSIGLSGLFKVKQQLFDFDPKDIAEGLRIVMGKTRGIKGLHTIGASGLLALMHPKTFGTIDQVVVESLTKIGDLPEIEAVLKMHLREDGKKKSSIEATDGVLLIEIMQRKAASNNKLFKTNHWTPRKIDQVLWACRVNNPCKETCE